MAGRKNRQKAVPEAERALNRLKFEVAEQLGIDLNKGYNDDLTSKEAGSVGGQMVKKMIEQAEEQMAGKQPK